MVLYGNLKILIMINENTTIREFLQVLGTECLREQLNPNIHVFALFSDYKPTIERLKEKGELIGNGKFLIKRIGKDIISDSEYVEYDKYSYPNWIITDCRFPNEAQAIKDKGGIVIRVNRPDYSIQITEVKLKHPSETSLDNWEFDYVIENNGTIEELIHKVKEMLEKCQMN